MNCLVWSCEYAEKKCVKFDPSGAGRAGRRGGCWQSTQLAALRSRLAHTRLSPLTLIGLRETYSVRSVAPLPDRRAAAASVEVERDLADIEFSLQKVQLSANETNISIRKLARKCFGCMEPCKKHRVTFLMKLRTNSALALSLRTFNEPELTI
ncbi:unnamed protein product [Colias eurytheme]|nr:unnamed protein product [Colias eurytheme]